jgi:hypothetical protein
MKSLVASDIRQIFQISLTHRPPPYDGMAYAEHGGVPAPHAGQQS